MTWNHHLPMSVPSKPRNSSASSSAVVGLKGQIQLCPSKVAMEVRCFDFAWLAATSASVSGTSFT